MLLLRALQSDANNKNVRSPITWDALNNASKAYGSPVIDYERFAQRWETDPDLQNIVDRFDRNGLVIKTNAESPQIAPQQPTGNSGIVSQMAKRAAKKNRRFD